VAKRNATSHGIMSEAPVVGRETEEEWLAHRQGVEESLAPVGHLEMCIAERIALLFLAFAEGDTVRNRDDLGGAWQKRGGVGEG
jgi:hypothetical protein